jgi:hypothetical protein
MKKRIGKYIINTDLITHIYKEDDNNIYRSDNTSQCTWVTLTDVSQPETIYICFGECFLTFYKGHSGYSEALELYNEFENESKL